MKKLILIMFLSTLTGALSIGLFKASAPPEENYLAWSTYNYYEEYWGMRVTDYSLNPEYNFSLTIPASSYNLVYNDNLYSKVTLYDIETDTTTEITFEELILNNIILSLNFNSTIDFDSQLFENLEKPYLPYDTISIQIIQSGDYNEGAGVPSGYVNYYIENGYIVYDNISGVEDIDSMIMNWTKDLDVAFTIIIMSALILIVTLGLFYLKIPSLVIFFTDLVFLSSFYLLGWIPAWILVLIVMILFVFIIFKMKGSD